MHNTCHMVHWMDASIYSICMYTAAASRNCRSGVHEPLFVKASAACTSCLDCCCELLAPAALVSHMHGASICTARLACLVGWSCLLQGLSIQLVQPLLACQVHGPGVAHTIAESIASWHHHAIMQGMHHVGVARVCIMLVQPG